MMPVAAFPAATGIILRLKKMSPTIRLRLSTSIALATAACLAWLGTLVLVAAGRPPLAIRGYDPVAYFTDGGPTPGRAEYSYVWEGVRWQFASHDHQLRFATEPERYTPHIYRLCGLAPAIGPADAGVNPSAWTIVDGRLYLNRPQITQISTVPVPDGGL
jgi:YHS domain-containing protein